MKKNCKGLPGCNKKQDKLSLLKRAQNLIATTTKHVANGLKNISDTDYIQRVVECTKCEKLCCLNHKIILLVMNLCILLVSHF